MQSGAPSGRWVLDNFSVELMKWNNTPKLGNSHLDYGGQGRITIILIVIMEVLGLEVIRLYHEFNIFHSKHVKCIGILKGMVSTLAQITSKIILHVVVVADVPPRYDMLFSRNCAKRMRGTMKMDMKYATIPLFASETRILYI